MSRKGRARSSFLSLVSVGERFGADGWGYSDSPGEPRGVSSGHSRHPDLWHQPGTRLPRAGVASANLEAGF